MQVLQEVVGIRLRYIRSVEIQRKEHYGSPYHDADINLSNDFLQSQISHLHSSLSLLHLHSLPSKSISRRDRTYEHSHIQEEGGIPPKSPGHQRRRAALQCYQDQYDVFVRY